MLFKKEKFEFLSLILRNFIQLVLLCDIVHG
jgi:hypothetical protein